MRIEWYIHKDGEWHILARFVSERGAKVSLSRKWKKKYPKAIITDSVTFYKMEPMVETTNIMSGKKIMIEASLKGGCCDPGTETYWSM